MYKDEKFWNRITSKFDITEQNKTEFSQIYVSLQKSIS
jgi:hypothetical protein